MSQTPPVPNQSMWHYQLGAQQLGPVPFQTLIPMIQNATITASTLVWTDPMPQWAAAGTLPQFGPYFSPAQAPAAPYLAEANSKKMMAGLFGIFLGAFGVHKFVLGYTATGVIFIVITVVATVVTCGLAGWVMGVIGLVEGIIYLTKSDQEFYNTYIVNKKQWF
jgi:TM2 domain-containing membrane protein YozV